MYLKVLNVLESFYLMYLKAFALYLIPSAGDRWFRVCSGKIALS